MIPVFYHVPKCAGTYVQNSAFHILNMQMHNCIRTYLQDQSNHTVAILIGPPTRRVKTRYVYQDYQEFKKQMPIKNLQVKCLIICDQGFSIRQEILGIFKQPQQQYMLLRHPYERAYSLYHYLTSNNSKHEPSHGSIQSKSFDQYLQSYEMEDSWLIRQLLNIEDNEIINQQHFNNVCQILDHIVIEDISNADDLLKQMFGTNNRGNRPIYRNDSKSVQMRPPLSSFDQQIIDKFKERTIWDHKIYNHYVNKSQP